MSVADKVEENPQKPAYIKYLGFVLLFSSVFLAIAFVSYIFTWKADQDKASLNFFTYLLDSKIQSENIFGKLGSYFSHLFIYNGLGISMLLLCPALFVLSIYLLASTWLVKPWSFFKKIFFWIVYTSLFTGFFFTDEYGWIGGVFGYQLSHLLANWLGSFGFISAMLFVLFTFLSFSLNWNFTSFFQGLVSAKEKKATIPILEPETKNTENTIPIRENKYTDPIPMSTGKHSKFTEVDLMHKEMPIEEDESDVLAEPELEDEQVPDEALELELKTLSAQDKAVQNLDLELEVSQPEETLDMYVPQEAAELEPVSNLKDPYDPTLDLGSFKMPSLDLLIDFGDAEININREELEANKNRIVSTLGNYNIEIAKIKATVGPTVTLYEIIPAPGVRISKIKNLEDDIALSLSALGIRIIAPIPGKGTIGIEVPNQNPEMVGMRSILHSEKFTHAKMDLPIALGKTISNEVYVADLAKMPHLLMAGATGQGKSVGLNAILVSLLYKKHPSQIKFVLVDPKKVELTLFNKIERHYLAKLPGTEEAIITDTKKVVNTLNSLCIEMDHRYELLKDAQVRNIKEYNAKFVDRKLNPEHGHKFLPYIVLVVDEFADLIMTAGKEVETPIARLAQLARAIGIHLIIATQRPSVNIITGTIKANFPSRIAFRVTSKVDSRTILDSGGADQLIGKGDMLVSLGSDLTRIQCAFVDTPEVEKICDFIGSQRGYPDAFMLPEYIDESSEEEKEAFSMEDRDKLFEEAARIIVTHQQGSASLLQRKLKLGYNRAGRLVDQLEAAGILGPFEGSKPRQVMYTDLNSLEQFLIGLKKD